MRKKAMFSEIKQILSRANYSAKVIQLKGSKIILAYKLPDFSEMDGQESRGLLKRVLKLKLNFEPTHIIETKEGLVIFDTRENVQGYTYSCKGEEVFNKFNVESKDTPSHTIDNLFEMQKMINQHFGGYDDE